MLPLFRWCLEFHVHCRAMLSCTWLSCIPTSIPFICLCLLVVHVDVGDGLRCMTVVCSECRCCACSIASSWWNACMVALLICSCMIFIVDASSSAMFMSSVVLVIFMLVIMPCSVGHDWLLIWWIVMLYPDAYVDIMLMHYICIMLFYHGSTYLHSSLTGLNWTWTTVGWVMVPPYRSVQCNHAYLYGKVLTGSIVMPLAGASNKGRLWACATLAR